MRYLRFAVSDHWSLTGLVTIAFGASLYLAAILTWGA